MGRTVTLELPEPVADRVAEVAAFRNRRMEDVMAECLSRFAANPPMEFLTDAEVLMLADSELSETESAELSGLLADRQEGQLTPEQTARYEVVMREYGRRQVRKAEGLVEAVRRGLRPRGPYG